MHANRAGILGVADHRDHLAHASGGGVIDQARNQRLADPLPANVLANVDAVLGAEPIGRAVTKLGVVGITENSGGIGRHQPRPASLQHLGDAVRRLLDRRRNLLERARAG
jgi:hypothetical protein